MRRSTAPSRPPAVDSPLRTFHVLRSARDACGFDDTLFAIRGDVIFGDMGRTQAFAALANERLGMSVGPTDLHAMGLLHELLHAVLALYRRRVKPDVFRALLAELSEAASGPALSGTLLAFVDRFPPPAVYRGEVSAAAWLAGQTDGVPNEEWAMEELVLLWLTNQNPAYAPIAPLISDAELRETTAYGRLMELVHGHFAKQPRFGPHDQNLVDMLLSPARHAPNSLADQLKYIRDVWGLELDGLDEWLRLLMGLDLFAEEGRWHAMRWHGFHKAEPSGPVSFRGYEYDEPERFSADVDWMPHVVMIAKSTLVWLDQLSSEYGKEIRTLDQVPDEELDRLAARGFNALWLIGVWRRSEASKRIKQIAGNSEAAASAYSLHDYSVSPELGGEDGYRALAERAGRRGIRLASDMVPNHMGLDSSWVISHPEWFLQSRHPPFPGYRFDGPDLSSDPRVSIFIESGYWSRTDAAVVFKWVDRRSGEVRYLYHGNDGTSMPWNDTAQLDYRRAEVREAVIQTILGVARRFPIIRFDAAMTLAKKHYQRLWFPIPGTGGGIPSRAAHGMTRESFDEVFPVEFWREVVDRVAQEAPNTLLLAEAFWLMEGYFVRTLGMHRVYNSAFMNMLKREDNAAYRQTIKNVLEYDPRILNRFVNFMNNPDEETAVMQFGKDGKYFAVATMMATMPGLPMFGHGQVEGLEERYGMEYARAYKAESPDEWLVGRHEREIFPLLRRRALFSGVTDFFLYDLFTEAGHVDEDVFAYSNRSGAERSLVLVHNKWKETSGWLKTSVAYRDLTSGVLMQRTLGEALGAGHASGSRHDDSASFLVLKDAVTGLEYLRSCRELRESGLFFSLGAFQVQVFWGIREVVDAPGAPYARLDGELQGRGTASIADALVDLSFRAIHDSYFEAVNAGSARFLVSAWRGLGATRADARVELAGKVRDLASGIRYAVPSLVPQLSEGRVRDVVTVVAARIGALAAAIDDGAMPALDPEIDAVLLWVAAFFTEAAEQLRGEEPVADEGGERLADAVLAWHLDRPLVRALRQAGASEAAAARGAALVRLLVQPADDSLVPRERVASRLRDATTSAEGRDFLEVNVWDGVVWFSKERFESLALALCAAELLGRPSREASGRHKEGRSREAGARPPVDRAPAPPSAAAPSSIAPPPPWDAAHEARAFAAAAEASGYRLAALRTRLEAPAA